MPFTPEFTHLIFWLTNDEIWSTYLAMNVDGTTILDLIEAALAADYTAVRRIGNRLARGFAEAGDQESARSIQSILRKRGVPLQASGYSESLPRDAGSRLPLIEEGSWPTNPLFFDDSTAEALDQFVVDARNIHMLAEKGVSSRLGLLLYGPPGTGKSMIAGYIAAKLGRPFYIARLDSLISSRLGETSKNIREVFNFIPTREAVLFLDEMDAIAKLRDDRHELGELKRVVNTVLQGLDSLTDDIIVIGATNHAHLLDPAIWRRFPYKLDMALPDEEVRVAMWEHFLFEDAGAGVDARLLARLSSDLSGADIENLSLAARRRAILRGDSPSVAHLVLAIDASRRGSRAFPDGRELGSSEKRAIARQLDEADAPVTEIARIVGVSRQMAHRYLKDVEDG
jgi:MoxR-like ATPase